MFECSSPTQSEPHRYHAPCPPDNAHAYRDHAWWSRYRALDMGCYRVGVHVAWSTDRERGRAMFLFDAEDNARAALEQTLANMPADAPMEIETVEVCEVVAHG